MRPDQIHEWQNDMIFKDDLLVQWKSACLWIQRLEVQIPLRGKNFFSHFFHFGYQFFYP